MNHAIYIEFQEIKSQLNWLIQRELAKQQKATKRLEPKPEPEPEQVKQKMETEPVPKKKINVDLRPAKKKKVFDPAPTEEPDDGIEDPFEESEDEAELEEEDDE